MNSVVTVDFAEKEVEIKKKEVKKKKRVVDTYDMEDPFYQEDEIVNTFECRYDNFFCLSGESHIERRKDEAEQKEERDERSKKEKKETTRERYLQQKQEKLEEYSTAQDEPEKKRVVKELVILEVLTAQEPSASRLVEEMMRASPNANKLEVEKTVENLMGTKGLEKLQDETEIRTAEITQQIKQELQRRIDRAAESPEGRQLQFDDELFDLLVEYTEVEYLLFYIKLFLAGKKRILEHKVKKNIVKNLQELFPVEYRSVSLGKKIASYIIKRRKSEQSKESHSEENLDSNSNSADDDTPNMTAESVIDESEKIHKQPLHSPSTELLTQETEDVDSLSSEKTVKSVVTEVGVSSLASTEQARDEKCNMIDPSKLSVKPDEPSAKDTPTKPQQTRKRKVNPQKDTLGKRKPPAETDVHSKRPSTTGKKKPVTIETRKPKQSLLKLPSIDISTIYKKEETEKPSETPKEENDISDLDTLTV